MLAEANNASFATGGRMLTGDEYREQAAELCARANKELKRDLRHEYQALAFCCMKLAEIADRRAVLDPGLGVDSDQAA
jgi:hypothetical protein